MGGVRAPLVLPEVASLASVALLANNHKAKNLLYAGLGRQEYNRICNLETAHEIWHTLETYCRDPGYATPGPSVYSELVP